MLNRLCALYTGATIRRVKGFPKITATLQVKPEVCRIAEHTSQHQCNIDRNCSAIVAEATHKLPLHSHSFGNLRLCERHGL
ncbi:hypothetical protein D3C78_458650 [compost metagenome]